MTIMVLEDDDIQAKMIARQLKKAFPSHEVEMLGAEHDFVERFEKIAGTPPEIFVIDVMLRWTRPREDMPPRPDRVQREGPNRAGFRCTDMLAADERTRGIPVVLYTVLQDTDIRHELVKRNAESIYVRKQSDSHALIDLVRKRLTAERAAPHRAEG